jgi:mannose-6-phosphate isomerase-like protein (cupin superfamily)
MTGKPIILAPGAGRAYDLGPVRGVFKADGTETEDRYCVSEWSVEPGQRGPGPHDHDANEELFLVTEGTMSFLVEDRWIDAPAGTFIRIPAGVTHDFENCSSEPATAVQRIHPRRVRSTLPGVVAAARGKPPRGGSTWPSLTDLAKGGSVSTGMG